MKKQKIDNLYYSKPIHSSLSYNSIRAPPLVEYKSVYNYCENIVGKSLLRADNEINSSPSTSGLDSLQSMSSPIVFKTTMALCNKKSRPGQEQPYTFISVEELSLAKCLKNWMNTKICPIGLVSYEYDSQLYYINSVMELGQWRLMLDTSLLSEIPKLNNLMQFYGTLEISDEKPKMKVHFVRKLGSVNLSIFIESYKLMQKYVPKPVYSASNKEIIGDILVEDTSPVNRSVPEFNDTLDDYNFDAIL